MKKTLSILLVAFLTLILSSSLVFAVISFTVGLTVKNQSVAVGDEVAVTVSLKDFTTGDTGINAIEFYVDYDTAVFEILEKSDITLLNGWGTLGYASTSSKVTTLNSSYMSEAHDVLTMTFKVKDKAKLGDTVITVRDIAASDAKNEITPSNQSITVKVGEKAQEPVKNEVPTVNNVVPNEPAPENPSTGIEDFTVPVILVVSVLGIITYIRYRNLEK